mmetsp:Transcript_37613/g.81975  ORF Transcript_37613/g.81975 Transcript_37613/m.81975 type:complete len:437 (+) Transcript_37613:104-1414(+)
MPSRKRKDKRSKQPPAKDTNAADAADDAATTSTTAPAADANATPHCTDDMTLRQVFNQHPLIQVGKFIAIPYLLYLGYYYLQLQHPDYLSKATAGIISLRPAVDVTDPRQLLIIASPSSGTAQIKAELEQKLRLEIGHETTDTAWHFVRDGTVSWFHGIRFLTEPSTNEGRAKSFSAICSSGEEHANMGFHPAAYRPPVSKCSYRSKWDDCWMKECYLTLVKEWGCSAANNCEINFARNIHQVRNPMRTLESLVVKFCVGGLAGTVADSFLIYASALFPQHNFYEDSCIEATGYFLVEYQNAMIEARKRGEISAFYRIEETTACEVADMAGMLSPNTTVYAPNYNRIKRICDVNNTDSPARQVVEKEENKVNTDIVRLGWKDLRGGMHGSMKKEGNTDLEKKVKELFKALGYDESKEVEEQVPIDDKQADEAGDEL